MKSAVNPRTATPVKSPNANDRPYPRRGWYLVTTNATQAIGAVAHRPRDGSAARTSPS